MGWLQRKYLVGMSAAQLYSRCKDGSVSHLADFRESLLETFEAVY